MLKPTNALRALILLIVCVVALAPAQDASSVLYRVVKNGRYGFVDSSGKMVIPPRFVFARDFVNGYTQVLFCGDIVYIDSQGNIASDQHAAAAGYAPDGRVIREIEGKFGFVDAANRLVVQPIYDEVRDFSEGLAAVRLGDRWGFVDRDGAVVVPIKFDGAYYFFSGRAYVILGDRKGYIDKSGEFVFQGFSGHIFSEGLLVMDLDGRDGYVDLNGKVVIPGRFEDARGFQEGLAPVRFKGKYGFIDRTGEFVIEPSFDDAQPFQAGLAAVAVKEKWGVIRKDGQFVVKPAFDWLVVADDVLLATITRYKFAVLDHSGHYLFGPEEGVPDHAPLLGWTKEEITASCEFPTEN
jgi:hypothetical protein